MCCWCNSRLRRGRLHRYGSIVESISPVPFFFSFVSSSHFLRSVSAPLSAPHCSLSALHSVLPPGGVGAGLLRPLRVGRVFKLYCSWQARGKPTVTTPFDCQTEPTHVSTQRESSCDCLWVHQHVHVRYVVDIITLPYLSGLFNTYTVGHVCAFISAM